MENSAFSFASLVSATQGNSADRTQNEVRTKSGFESQGLLESGIFASFLSEWTLAIEQMESEETLTTGSLDLTLSAEQGGAREERTTSLPLTCMNDTLLLSKSMLELMASIRDGLEEKGVDLKALSSQVGDELEKILPGMDLERLKATLSRLQDRYPVAMKSDGARHLDIEVALPDDCTIGLEASLTPSQDAVRNNVTNSSMDFLLFENEETDLSAPLALSRLYAYLKPDASRSMPASKSESVGTNDSSREKKEASAEQSVAMSTMVSVAATSAGSETSQDTADDGRKETLQGKTKNRDDLPAVSPRAEKTESESVRTVAPTERKNVFDQFFEGAVAARRDSIDVRPEPLDLAKETPLSRNDALREGLDNVVRFIRTGGEQKASVIVDPPALGRISVELTNGATGLEASIKVSSEQVRQLVQDQIVQLRMSLAQQGVELTHFSVDVQQDSGQQRHEADRQTGRSARRVSGRDDPDDAQDEQTVFRVDLNQGLLYWVA